MPNRSPKKDDAYYMARCLKLAAKGKGRVSPNPLVGAVIVKNGKIIAEGYHRRLGADHAEINALKKIKFKAKGATLYCNLEPCFHQGRTPPCVHPVIQSGISRIVIAHQDPNPKVAGKSIDLLRKSGIHVTLGVMEEEARYLNRFFITWVTRQRPYVFLKAAVSLDGKMTPPGRKTGWITGPKSRRQVHRLRSETDAVLVGIQTLLNDDPQLNVRGVRTFCQPWRVILDSRLRTPLSSKVLSSSGGPVLLACTRSDGPKVDSLKRKGAHLLPLKAGRDKRVPVKALLKSLADRGISSLLVEGGARVLHSFLVSGCFDELILFIAPQILGGRSLSLFSKDLKKSLSLHLESVKPHGQDLEVRLLP